MQQVRQGSGSAPPEVRTSYGVLHGSEVRDADSAPSSPTPGTAGYQHMTPGVYESLASVFMVFLGEGYDCRYFGCQILYTMADERYS